MKFTKTFVLAALLGSLSLNQVQGIKLGQKVEPGAHAYNPAKQAMVQAEPAAAATPAPAAAGAAELGALAKAAAAPAAAATAAPAAANATAASVAPATVNATLPAPAAVVGNVTQVIKPVEAVKPKEGQS